MQLNSQCGWIWFRGLPAVKFVQRWRRTMATSQGREDTTSRGEAQLQQSRQTVYTSSLSESLIVTELWIGLMLTSHWRMFFKSRLVLYPTASWLHELWRSNRTRRKKTRGLEGAAAPISHMQVTSAAWVPSFVGFFLVSQNNSLSKKPQISIKKAGAGPLVTA